MPVYQDCTLGEIVTIAVVTLVSMGVVLSIVSRILCGYFWPGYLLASGLFFFVTKFLIQKLQKMKMGKPYGYYRHLIHQRFSRYGMVRCRFVQRRGEWSVRRMGL